MSQESEAYYSSTELNLKDSYNCQDIVSSISQMTQQEVNIFLANRLFRLKTFLPSLLAPKQLSTEDPTDILVDCFDLYPGRLQKLQQACANVLGNWQHASTSRIAAHPEPIGELLYLCATLQVHESISSVAFVARRDDLQIAIIGTSEDIQCRALRSLSGLLNIQDNQGEREIYKDIFERSLKVPSHTPIALTTLVSFWPDEKEIYLTDARKHGGSSIEQVIKNLDWILQTF